MTFLISRFSPFLSSNQTSFSASANAVFRYKLMFEGLPTLVRLQQRRPDMYDQSWSCFLCGKEPETWDHLWRCTYVRLELHVSLIAFKSHIELAIRSLSASAFALLDSHLSFWDSLDCWKFPSDLIPDTSPTVLDYSFLFRGFIPLQLVQFLSSFFNKKALRGVLSDAVFFTQYNFRTHVWLSRCCEIKRLEPMFFELKEFNLGRVSSVQASSSGSLNNILGPSLPLSPNASGSSSASNRWVGWIGSMLSSGAKELMEGFPLRINISFI